MTTHERVIFESRIVLAIAALPLGIRRKYAGRDPEGGMDCAGLIVYLYGQAGFDLTQDDIVCPEGDIPALVAAGAIERQLSVRLRTVTDQVAAGLDRIGDVWVFSARGGSIHIGLQCNETLYHMADELHQRDAARIRPLLRAAFRP